MADRGTLTPLASMSTEGNLAFSSAAAALSASGAKLSNMTMSAPAVA